MDSLAASPTFQKQHDAHLTPGLEGQQGQPLILGSTPSTASQVIKVAHVLFTPQGDKLPPPPMTLLPDDNVLLSPVVQPVSKGDGKFPTVTQVATAALRSNDLPATENRPSDRSINHGTHADRQEGDGSNSAASKNGTGEKQEAAAEGKEKAQG
jgi:hypothetical protein